MFKEKGVAPITVEVAPGEEGDGKVDNGVLELGEAGAIEPPAKGGKAKVSTLVVIRWLCWFR